MDISSYLPSTTSLSKLFSQNNRPKVVSIGTAVTLALLYLVYDSVNKPPRKLRHIPYINYLTYITAMIRRDPFSKRSREMAMPLLANPSSNGCYLYPDRLGWTVNVTNLAAVKTVLYKLDKFSKADIKTGRENTISANLIGGENIIMLDGHGWKKHRKIANPAFHRSMPVKLFGRLTQTLFTGIDQRLNNVSVTSAMERLTLDIIGLAGFGFDFKSLSEMDNPWVKTYNSVINGSRNTRFEFFPMLDKWFLWLFPDRRHAHHELTKFKEMLTSVIKHKRQSLAENRQSSLDDNEKDLLTLMIESEMDGEGALSDNELLGDLVIFFIAGHDTTANALSFALYHLAMNPDIQEKARQEAIRILGDEPKDVIPTVDQTKEMEYINMVMKETLRIDGPVPALVSRVANEDCDFEGTFIPKGTLVTVNIYDLHHNSVYWENPGKFDPERFNVEKERQAGSGLKWIPFSNGGRQCLGMNFSLTEQRVVLSMLLRKYVVTLPENSPHKNGVITNSFGVMTPLDLKMNFKRRY